MSSSEMERWKKLLEGARNLRSFGKKNNARASVVEALIFLRDTSRQFEPKKGTSPDIREQAAYETAVAVADILEAFVAKAVGDQLEETYEDTTREKRVP